MHAGQVKYEIEGLLVYAWWVASKNHGRLFVLYT